MNISKEERRVLHVLAQGGFIRYERKSNGWLLTIDCFTHDGAKLVDCTLDIVSKPRRRRMIKSQNSSPYRISTNGLRAIT